MGLCMFFAGACASRKIALYGKDGAPLSIVEYEKLAQSERDANRYENAIKAYGAVLQHYPENTSAVLWATYETGFCYFKLEKYVEAEEFFRRVVDEFQDPAATKLSEDMLSRIVEKTTKKQKKTKKE
jgi:tetratricopeptide (TPR) repeat protein